MNHRSKSWRPPGRIILLLGGLLLGLTTADEALAQRRTQREFRPATPTLSPYLNLLQTNLGPVPNYFSLVRPRLEQDAFNRQIRTASRVRSLQIQALESEIQQPRPVSQTGKIGGFMEYLHYYPPPRTPMPLR